MFDGQVWTGYIDVGDGCWRPFVTNITVTVVVQDSLLHMEPLLLKQQLFEVLQDLIAYADIWYFIYNKLFFDV